MNLPETPYSIKALICVGMALGALAFISGCEEVHLGLDSLLGKTPAMSAAAQSFNPLFMAANKRPGKTDERTKAPRKSRPERAAAKKDLASLKGKRRAPGKLAPATLRAIPTKKKRSFFVVERDPFKAPEEILPTECPPSMPLCRFDRSQLKLVGVIQVNDGQFKGMVQDPDGRGYFITPGMQIHGSTVTQVSYKGVVLRDHKTQRDVLMRLFVEAKEPGPGEL
jgi:hypothetical protein